MDMGKMKCEYSDIIVKVLFAIIMTIALLATDVVASNKTFDAQICTHDGDRYNFYQNGRVEYFESGITLRGTYNVDARNVIKIRWSDGGTFEWLYSDAISQRCQRQQATSQQQRPAQQKTGVFTDSRNAQRYRTVRIGNRTWMAENLNFRSGNSWCYDNDESNCRKYGRLYDWNTAVNACPVGWWLPTRADWDDLFQTVGFSDAAAKRFMSKISWDGTDDFGFSALPSGLHNGKEGSFVGKNGSAAWWSATETGGNSAWRLMLISIINPTTGARGIMYMNGEYNSNGFSVRCVQ